jgi:hypothetical protein
MRSANRSTTLGTTQPPRAGVPPLFNGDRLTQAEFHRRYEAYPEDVKFELIGGIVYMGSPLRRLHGTYHAKLSGVLFLYEEVTPGVELLDNATTILGGESEPQPDLALRILPEWGGQSRTDEREYVVGAPELLAEIAHSGEAIDLHGKKEDYRHAGVQEYVVVCIREKELHWFDFAAQGEIRPDARGIYRSQVFPGLWLDGSALLARDLRRLTLVARQGRASRAHAAFVRRLEAVRRKRAGLRAAGVCVGSAWHHNAQPVRPFLDVAGGVLGVGAELQFTRPGIGQDHLPFGEVGS